jgi:hypothetical protein
MIADDLIALVLVGITVYFVLLAATHHGSDE